MDGCHRSILDGLAREVIVVRRSHFVSRNRRSDTWVTHYASTRRG
jgi:hypothetical protein